MDEVMFQAIPGSIMLGTSYVGSILILSLGRLLSTITLANQSSFLFDFFFPLNCILIGFLFPNWHILFDEIHRLSGGSK